jgi:excisionase family DNA binding protein
MGEKLETPPILVGVERACELLAVRRTLIYKLIAEEKLRPVKLGRRTVFRYADLVAFADQMGRATA